MTERPHKTVGRTRSGRRIDRPSWVCASCPLAFEVSSPKRGQTEQGAVDVAVPRDRAGTCEPTVVKKRQRRLEGCEDKVLALYAHGLTMREIQRPLEEVEGAEGPPTLLSTMTDAVFEEVRLWQSRPLKTVYPILDFDCLFVTSRHDRAVNTKAVYVARGIT